MPRELRGEVCAPDGRVAIVVGRVNQMITERLLAGALDELRSAGVDEDKIDIVWVPGSFEIPAAARALLQAGQHSTLIVLGCVIRGETDHYIAVMTEAARGTAEIARNHGIGVGYGVLNCHTVEQALDRSGERMNMGREAARTALYMTDLIRKMKVLGGGTTQ